MLKMTLLVSITGDQFIGFARVLMMVLLFLL
jgi:hypothetical protein